MSVGRAVPLVLLVLSLGQGVPTLGQREQGSRIDERGGTVGYVTLDRPVRPLLGKNLVIRLDDSVYEAWGGLRLRVEDGLIKEIVVTQRYYATSRLIRARVSTLEEVLAAYGSPEAVCTRGGRLTFVYPDIQFVADAPFFALTDFERERFMEVPVKEIVLAIPLDAERVLAHARRAMDLGDWSAAADLLERSICREHHLAGEDTTLEAASSREPHLHLARAWIELGECASARAELELATRGGDLRESSELVLLERFADECGTS